MHRAVVYIDGFNLYFGLRSKGWRRYYWLNVAKLAGYLVKKHQRLESVHYFTARLPRNANSNSRRRQGIYLNALNTLDGLVIRHGHFLEKSRKCDHCGAVTKSFEEKMTDVNIAAQMLVDAVDDRYDTALLVSADSDLTGPVELIRSRFAGKRIVIAKPPGLHSATLCRAASAYFTIGEANLRRSQLPPVIRQKGKQAICRPSRWA